MLEQVGIDETDPRSQETVVAIHQCINAAIAEGRALIKRQRDAAAAKNAQEAA
jgi:hypothetical protein